MSEKIKMGIISDTHGLLREEVKERLKDCTYIFHAGDVDRPEILDELRGDNGSDDCGKWFLGSRKNRASKGTAVEKKPKSSLIIVER